jgi:hypothetical protein
MFYTIIRALVSLIFVQTLVYSSLANADQLSLPTGDLEAPEISHEVIPETLEAGSSVQLKATVYDNVGVKSVTMFYRTKGENEYKRVRMNQISDTHVYAITLGKNALVSPGVEYYIQAVDLAGNSLLHGYSFSPLNLTVVAAAVPATEATDSVAEVSAGESIPKDPKREPDAKKTKTWIWIALGALAAGAVAALASQSGGSDDQSGTASAPNEKTSTVTVGAPLPSN